MYGARHDSALGVQSRGGPDLSLVVFGAATAAVTVIVLVLALTASASVPGQAVAGQKRPAPPAPLDRDTDPCGLLRVGSAALATFGSAQVGADIGSYGECRISVRDKAGNQSLVSITLAAPGEFSTSAVGTSLGPVTVYREPPDGQRCTRIVTRGPGTPDDTPSVGITVEAQRTAPGGDPVSTCAMADTVADGAATTLSTRTPQAAPRLAANSVTTVDPCTLLAPDEIATVPGVNGALTSRAFSGWGCYWGTSPFVRLSYGRYLPPENGEAMTTESDSASCAVTLHRAGFTSTDGTERVETVTILVQGVDVSEKRACSMGRNLATAVLDRLPPV